MEVGNKEGIYVHAVSPIANSGGLSPGMCIMSVLPHDDGSGCGSLLTFPLVYFPCTVPKHVFQPLYQTVTLEGISFPGVASLWHLSISPKASVS